MSASRDMVYEALGEYVRTVHSAVFVGIARGKVLLYKNGTYELTPPIEPLPFLSVFYSGGTLCIGGSWMEGKRTEAVFLRLVPFGIEVREDEINITFKPRDGGIVLVVLQGNDGLARTLRSLVKECRETSDDEILIASRVSPEVSSPLGTRQNHHPAQNPLHSHSL